MNESKLQAFAEGVMGFILLGLFIWGGYVAIEELIVLFL